MVLSIIAAVLVVGVVSAGPVLINESSCSTGDSGAASEQTVSSRGCTKCDVDRVQALMRSKKLPKELKVEVEGKLYSVPDDAEMVTRTPQVAKTKWWKRIWKRDRSLSRNVGGGDSPGDAKPSDSDRSATRKSIDDGEAAVAEKTARSAAEHSCQICFGQEHSTVILPCGHGGLCWDCGLQIYALTEECPFCRSKIELLVPLDSRTRRYEGEDEFVSSAGYGEDGRPLVASRSGVSGQ